MEPFIPFASPYLNGLPSWHYDVNYDYYDDSGYESEDPEIVPSPSQHPNHIYEENNQDHHDPLWTWHHQATAFINAQWSPPTASRACHLHLNSIDGSRRPYNLPQMLSCEQRCAYHESEHQRAPSTFHSHENFRQSPGHILSWENLQGKTLPLDAEEHRARIPDALQSVRNRIGSEPDESSSSPNSTPHGSSTPEAKPDVLRTRRPTRSTEPGHRTEVLIPLSAGRPRHKYTTLSHNVQLTAARQEDYHEHERRKFDKERRAPRRKNKQVLATTEGAISFKPARFLGRGGW